MNLTIAKQTLDKAYKDALARKNNPAGQFAFIDYVIGNTHLTYKYVLFTALLAKASDASVNPLCLQKGSKLTGAYDARSVCHKVIVPFEMETLEKALGGSNEPFLNKPARFTELSTTNAVRKGNDLDILTSLCVNLPKISSSKIAYNGLVYLLKILIDIRTKKKSLNTFTIQESANLPAKLLIFIETALEKSYEGEILTLLVAGVYHLMYADPIFKVAVHPVNQCGASSKEISDLDIFANDKLISSNELKDKAYSETDVRHAADKVISAGGTKMLFVEGPRGKANGTFVSRLENEYLSKNFMLQVITYRNLFAGLIGTMNEIDVHEFISYIIKTAQQTKFKEEVIVYLDSLAQKEFGLSR